MRETPLTLETFRAITTKCVLVRVFMDLWDDTTNIQLFTEVPSHDNDGPLFKFSYKSHYFHEDKYTDIEEPVWQMIPIERIGDLLRKWSENDDDDDRRIHDWTRHEQIVVCKKPHGDDDSIEVSNEIPAALFVDFGRLSAQLLKSDHRWLQDIVVRETFCRRLDRFLLDQITGIEQAATRIFNLVQ